MPRIEMHPSCGYLFHSAACCLTLMKRTSIYPYFKMELRAPAIAYGKQQLTIEAYLERGNAQTEKHEYYRG